jgi:hypothetical protein
MISKSNTCSNSLSFWEIMEFGNPVPGWHAILNSLDHWLSDHSRWFFNSDDFVEDGFTGEKICGALPNFVRLSV